MIQKQTKMQVNVIDKMTKGSVKDMRDLMIVRLNERPRSISYELELTS